MFTKHKKWIFKKKSQTKSHVSNSMVWLCHVLCEPKKTNAKTKNQQKFWKINPQYDC